MVDNQPIKTKSNPMRIISITGGKGGVGKTTISVNLAIALAKMQKKVLLFDADLGLANVDIMLGLNPKRNLYDVLQGNCSLSDICLTGPHGIHIIPSASGIQKMADLTTIESRNLIGEFSTLTDDVDYMIIDMAAGISSQVIDFTHASQDVLVVVCNYPASLIDSYAVIKILNQKYSRRRFGIVVNKVKSSYEGFNVFSKFQETINSFLDVSLQFLGHIPDDDYIGIAAKDRISVVDKFPQSDAVHAFNNLCHGINNWIDDQSLAGGIHFFFERLTQST